MKAFNADSADEVWRQISESLLFDPLTPSRSSRYGNVKEMLQVGFTISDPTKRWIVNRQPVINAAFAIAEVVWILTGRNDTEFLTFFNSKLPNYVGNVITQRGAYGHRLRSHFGFDQLDRAAKALAGLPTSRQIVLQIWDSAVDLPMSDGLPRDTDIPCNVVSFLKVVDRKLHWTQVMRSNDIYRGTPYNIVQFTTLQEVMAGWIGVEVGAYNHFADSLHIYTRDLRNLGAITNNLPAENTDSLALPRRKFDQEISALEHSIDRMIARDFTQLECQEMINSDARSVAYKNLQLVLLAETARRRGWKAAADHAIAPCSNPILIQLWSDWITRVGWRTDEAS